MVVNTKKWRRETGLLQTLNEYDIALDTHQLQSLTDKSTKDDKAEFERWTTANKVALSTLSGMKDTLRGGIKKHDLAVYYRRAIENKFKEPEKAEISHWMNVLTTFKFDVTGLIDTI